MPPRPARTRPLGTMIAYGFPRVALAEELALAARLGALCLEILPDWAALPDPRELRARAADAGLAVHSAHGCWGGRTIRAPRVDLGQTHPAEHRAGLDDLRRCLDWLHAAGGTYLVVHPGGLSDPEQAAPRRAALAGGLRELADHARGTGLVVCVENMPPGVHPGSRMADLADLLAELARPELALALDTGHANITATAAAETLAAGTLLRTTHVHDNNGRHDAHEPPGSGTVDWDGWTAALDAIGYAGPVLLECIRHLRHQPECLNERLFALLDRLTAGGRRVETGRPPSAT
ncbi:MAG TPA: sugar phosphate isomerase/epimerase family protein [Isosphaeraceae bacterium]